MVSMNFKTCDKCQGEGWLWWDELDFYDGPAFIYGRDDQKYTCDKCEGCGCTMKADFTVKLFDDESTYEKLAVMSPLEAMFDDERNKIPDTYYQLLDNIKTGQSLRITVEVEEV